MDPIPLAEEDRAILALESDTVAGHTCKVVVVGDGGPGLDALRASVASRIERAPALVTRLGEADGAPAWVAAEGFDPADHVVAAAGGASLDEAALRATVSELFAQRLERDRPLWRMDVATLDDGRTAVIWRVHHALADGTTTMRFADAVLWDPAEAAAATTGASHPHHPDDQARRRAHLAAFVEREFAESRHRSPFDGTIGRRRRVEFASVPLAGLHDAAKALDGATVNDAILGVVAGALRRWVEAHHGPLGAVRVRVPVSLHHEGDDAGNRDSFFTLPLPLNEPDPVARLRDVHAATTARKRGRDAEERDELLERLGGASPRLRNFCERIEASPRRFALSVSNVPGPRVPVAVSGAPVTSVHSLAEIGERHALRIAVVSVAGVLCFGFCADPGVVDDLEALAAGVEEEAAALIAAAAV
jgi:hypothetical protein